MAKAKTAKIQYLISYDLVAKDGEERDYKSLRAALKRMGAEPFMKSQWRYEPKEGMNAKGVAKKVLSHLKVGLAVQEVDSQVAEASGSVKKAPPIFKFEDDKLLISPFPRNSGQIHLVTGVGGRKEESL